MLYSVGFKCTYYYLTPNECTPLKSTVAGSGARAPRCERHHFPTRSRLLFPFLPARLWRRRHQQTLRLVLPSLVVVVLLLLVARACFPRLGWDLLSRRARTLVHTFLDPSSVNPDRTLLGFHLQRGQLHHGGRLRKPRSAPHVRTMAALAGLRLLLAWRRASGSCAGAFLHTQWGLGDVWENGILLGVLRSCILCVLAFGLGCRRSSPLRGTPRLPLKCTYWGSCEQHFGLVWFGLVVSLFLC